MAARGEVTWDAEQFQMDRFGLNIAAKSTGLTEAGEKLLGVLGPRPSSLCQVRVLPTRNKSVWFSYRAS